MKPTDVPQRGDPQSVKRAIRTQLARLRRRIDRRVRRVGREGWEVVLWPRWFQRHPAEALLAAVGLGLLLSAALHPERWARILGPKVVRHTVERWLATAARDLGDLWQRLAPKTEEPHQTQSSGADHG